MTFFNKKEEVINIELTPYGRSLMALGKLKPAYYAFFDDDILYDTMAAGESTPEAQNLIQTRILKETPRIKTQRCLESPEKLIYTSEQDAESIRPHVNLKLNYLTEPLGTSDPTTIYGPAWKSTFYLGEISGTVDRVLSGSTKYLKQIPQINSTIEYKMQVANTSDLPPVSGLPNPSDLPVSQVWPDGTYIKLLDEQIICRLLEKEGFLLKEGLEVSAYLFDDSETEALIPLKFRPPSVMIKDGILLDDVQSNQVVLDPSYVEYYINFNTDQAVPAKDVCEGVSKLKAANVEIGFEIDCDDVETVDFDIYGSRVTEIEDCD